MKRKLDQAAEAASASAPSSSSSAATAARPEATAAAAKRPAPKKRKERLNPVKGMQKKESDLKPEIVFRKNVELAIVGKRLRRKLKVATGELNSKRQAEQALQATLSAVTRAMDDLTRGAAEILAPVGISEADVAALEAATEKAKDSKGGTAPANAAEFAAALYGRPARKQLLRDVSAAVRSVEAIEDDDEEEEEEEEGDAAGEDDEAAKARRLRARWDKLPALADAHSQRGVKRMLALMQTVATKVLAGASEGAAARLASGDPAQLKLKLRGAERAQALYEDRCTALEARVRALADQCEDLENERDKVLRRLALVCNDALREGQVLELASKMGLLKDGAGAAAAGGASAAAAGEKKAAGDAADAGEKGEGGSSAASAAVAAAAEDASAEAKELQQLADDRLAEIERTRTEKKALIDELEKLRAEAASSAAAAAAAAATSSNDRAGGGHLQAALDSALREAALLRGEANLARQEREAARANERDAQAALEDFERRTASANTELEGHHAASAAEKDNMISTLRRKVEDSAVEAKALQRATKVEAYKAAAEAAEARAAALEAERARHARAPAVAALKEQLAKQLEGKWPGDAGKARREDAKVQSELEVLRAESEGNAAVVGELEAAIEETTERLKEVQAQNARLLRDNEAKEKEGERWSRKVLDMNDLCSKARRDRKLAGTERDEARRQLAEKDAHLEIVSREVEAQERKAEAAEALARSAHEQASRAAQETEALRAAAAGHKEERERLQAALAALEAKNAEFREEKEDAEFARNRADEERKRTKRKLERQRSTADSLAALAGGGEGGGDLAKENMTQALRCPLRSEYWKDCIITSCCHMFSRKALQETLASRNRKCPTCKHGFSQGDIKDIHLYLSNNYDD